MYMNLAGVFGILSFSFPFLFDSTLVCLFLISITYPDWCLFSVFMIIIIIIIIIIVLGVFLLFGHGSFPFYFLLAFLSFLLSFPERCIKLFMSGVDVYVNGNS